MRKGIEIDKNMQLKFQYQTEYFVLKVLSH